AANRGLVRPQRSRDQTYHHGTKRCPRRVCHMARFQSFDCNTNKIVLIKSIFDRLTRTNMRQIEPLKIAENICDSLKAVADTCLLIPDKPPKIVPGSHVVHKQRYPYQTHHRRGKHIGCFALRVSEKKCRDRQNPKGAEADKAP